MSNHPKDTSLSDSVCGLAVGSAPRTIYLDNAATSFPKAPGVVEAVVDYLETVGASAGRGGHSLARQADALLWETRTLLAKLLGVSDPRRVIFALNVTQALNMALMGLLEKGDHVVTTSMEHNSVMRPLRYLERVREIKISVVEGDRQGTVSPERVVDLIGPRTRLVVINHASNVTGGVLPVEKVAEAKGEALLLVDAAQSAGSLPIHMGAMGIDMLAFTGHKALLGPPGVGGICLAAHVDIPPLIHGGTGTSSESHDQPTELPFGLEAGTHNMAGIAGLRAALMYLLKERVESIRTKELGLMERLLRGLSEIDGLILYGPQDPQSKVPVFSVNMDGMHPSHLATTLESCFGILVRDGLHCAPSAHKTLGTFPNGTVRISLGPLQDQDTVETVIEAFREISHELKR